MNPSMASDAALSHLLSSEHSRPMVKADLRLSERGTSWAELLGQAIDRARQARGWNMDEIGQAVSRDPAQVRRWITAKESPKWDALFGADEDFRLLLVIELAKLCHRCQVTTTISIGRN